jgi:hypothetical protein
MNASVEVSRLLEQSGAVLVRHKKHLVYRLPNGQNFISPKTPGDRRNAVNQLSHLRRALAIEPAASNPTQQPSAQGAAPDEKEYNAMPATQNATQAPSAPATANVEEPKLSLKERLDAAIREGEAIQEKLMAEAQAAERRVGMLKVLLPYAEEPAAEEALRTILPAPPPPPAQLSAPQPPRVEPPQRIVERVQVTRQLVFAATQTFGEKFTVNDVMCLMTGGRQIDGKERLRVRQSIAAAMVSLHERGELLKVEEHYGRSQTVWQKAELNGKGHANGAHA